MDDLGPVAESPPSDRNLSEVVVPLLKGVLYMADNPAQWNALLDLQFRVRDYVAVLGLELMLDEAEGYAYLRSIPEDEDPDSPKRPRLVARRQLSLSGQPAVGPVAQEAGGVRRAGRRHPLDPLA